MYLLPKPQKLEIKHGYLISKKLCVVNHCTDERIEKALRFFDRSDSGTRLILKNSDGDSQGYTLDICENEISISGDSPSGVFYGIQTLRQIFDSEKVHCLHISDCPDMSQRGFYHDITRGKVPTVKTLKKLIDNLAYYKMNSLQLYVEHTFPFKEFGDDVKRFGYLSAEQLKELDEYCYDNFIEFIPSIATFGHLYELLQKDEYKHLGVLDNYEPQEVFWIERMNHHTIDPLNEQSFELVKSLIDQYLPLFRSDKFNICCDETFDLKHGRHKDSDIGKLYVDFVKKIIDYLKSKGKKVMMWGDILLQHPETIEELPKDTTFLNWYYGTEPDEKTFEVFKNSGCTQLVCPGTGTWYGFTETVRNSSVNILKMAELGHKYGAEGMLNTNWGDYGNPCSLELSMHGLILGASKSWNISTQRDEYFTQSINSLQYKNENAVKYISMLDDASGKVPWKSFINYYSNLIFGNDKPVLPEEKDIKYALDICSRISDELSGEIWQREEYRREIITAAEGIMIMCMIYDKSLRVKYDITISDWLLKFNENWLKSNKESELREIEKIFNYFI